MSSEAGWPFGSFVLGCGTFGGIGGSADLVGQGLDEEAAFTTMDEAVELGITLFDTAERYAAGASEEMIGRWLASRDASATGDVHIATKVAPPYVDGPGGRFDVPYIEDKFSGSLERLGLDMVEFLLTHAPDPDTPVEETLEALETVRASGRCERLGACNLNAAEFVETLDAADRLGVSGLEVIQNGYSLLAAGEDAEVRRICAERGVAFTPFSPLAGGVLTGKYRRDQAPAPGTRLALRPEGNDELLTSAAHDAIDLLRAKASGDYGVECGALALAWLAKHPEVTAPVVGPSRQAPHLTLAQQALGIELSQSTFDQIGRWFDSPADS